MSWLQNTDFNLLAIIFRFMVLILIALDLVLVNLKRTRGHEQLAWRTELKHEALKNGTVLATYALIFIVILIFDSMYFPQPSHIIIMDSGMLVGISVLLLIPKHCAITNDGVYANGFFRPWGKFKSYSVSKTLKQVRLHRKLRFTNPVILLTPDLTEVIEVVNNYMEPEE